MPKLRFAAPYLSVRPFEPIELPAFTLITGLNGSGKSHLLEAIDSGRVIVEGIQDFQTDIRLFNWATFVPQPESLFQTHALQNERQQILNQLDAAFTQYKDSVAQLIRQAGLPETYYSKHKDVFRLTLDELRALFADDAKASSAYNQIQQLAEQLNQHMRNQLQRTPYAQRQIDEYIRAEGIQLVTFDREDFMRRGPVAWGQVDMFQQSFSRLFVAYRDLSLRNDVQEVAKQRGRGDATPLTREEFIKKYNIPPWDFLNATLDTAGLAFTIDSPDPFENAPYQARLRKIDSDVEINFENLSSGEKILMSFANCLYYASDNRQIATFPKVLLLDEVDAPLHPSMARTMMKIIIETLVSRFDVKVISTTHSPSTLASAPEESIYVMSADRAGLQKTTKGKALNLLTTGVPTLAINFSGRRQVFVESEVDSKIYDRLYELLKSRLNSERSLSFMCVGTRTDRGDIGNGSAQVKRIVSALEETHNNTVLGLLDWDGKNVSSQRIKVLGEGTRDGIENCLFDPLLLASLIARDAHDHLGEIGLARGGGLMQLRGLSLEKLQEIASAVENLVLGGAQGAPRVEARYLGGFSLSLRQDYLTLDDHALESKILDTVPTLKKFSRSAGALMIHVVENLLPDFVDFLPEEIRQVLETLLTADIE